MSPVEPNRGVSPVVGVVLLVAVCVALAGTAGLALQSTATVPDVPPRARIDVAAHADGRIVLTHRGGDDLSVEDLRVRVAVDGERLTHQPPVPFFAARGFRAGPTGPFNSRAAGTWSVGERASFRVASTNDPPITAGSRVEVSVYTERTRIWRGSDTATATAAAAQSAPASSPAVAPAASPSPVGARATVVIAIVGS